jgi:Tfp pilus assembly protein PilW
MLVGLVIGSISLLTIVSVYWCVVRRSSQEQNAEAGQR